MTNCGKLTLVALLFSGAFALFAGDREATELYREGRQEYESQNYRDASKKFAEAELYADSAVIKSNALRARIAALRMRKLPYQEFEAIERMLTDYPEYADFVEMVNREYELGKMYVDGVREPAFWGLRWIPWLVGDDKSIEIYRKALERAPFSPNAPAARLRLAYLLDQTGDVKASLDELRRIIKEFPDSSQCKWAYLALGNGLFELSRRGDGDARYARESYDIFREFQSKFPDAPENDYVQTILAKSRDIQSERLLDIAEFYVKSGRKEAAERYFAQVIKEFPDTKSAEESEKKLVELDKNFVPDDFVASKDSRLQRYRAYQLPEESGKLLIVPGRNNRKYLLPIYDLGIKPKNVPVETATPEESKVKQ
ncbi:MAG: outer membrane protein assembly factor BamD [Victivallales bacterium]|jgi:outer membrane assembly lipoprotein YfiO|nr:outer membrane protein assembly factor BamD [Victivallales bacterium]